MTILGVYDYFGCVWLSGGRGIIVSRVNNSSSFLVFQYNHFKYGILFDSLWIWLHVLLLFDFKKKRNTLKLVTQEKLKIEANVPPLTILVCVQLFEVEF